MANVQPNNLQSGNQQDFHKDGSIKISSEDTIQTLSVQNGYSDDGRLRVSQDLPLFNDTVEGTTLNTNLWQTSLSGMTVTQGGGFITLNAASSIVAANYAILQSNKQFLKWVGNTFFFQGILAWLGSTQNIPIAGVVLEYGWANFSGAVVNVSDGIFLRLSAGGDFYIIQAFNGQEDATELVIASDGTNFRPEGGHFYLTEVLVTDEHIHVELVDIGTTTEEAGSVTLVNQTVTLLSTRPGAISVTHLPLAARLYNLVAPSVAAQFYLGGFECTQLDITSGRSYGEILAVNQKGAYQGPNTTAGLTQTANHTNSTSPTSATLSNTAAGYTTLGGRYQFVAPASAATDFCLFGYQVPSGVDLIIKKLRITAMNTGAAVATTATILDWAIAVNSSAVSLATVEGVGTWAPRRIDVGMHGFIVGAAIGTAGNDIIVDFGDGIVCNGGRFVQIIVQVPIGTATASQVIRGDVVISGYFE